MLETTEIDRLQGARAYSQHVNARRIYDPEQFKQLRLEEIGLGATQVSNNHWAIFLEKSESESLPKLQFHVREKYARFA